MIVKIDLKNVGSKKYRNVINGLKTFNSNLPEEDMFILPYDTYYTFEKTPIVSEDIESNPDFIMFDTEKDFMTDIDDGDIEIFFLGEKPKRIDNIIRTGYFMPY